MILFGMRKTIVITILSCLVGFVQAETAANVVERLMGKLSSETLAGEFQATVTSDRGEPTTAYSGFVEMRDKVFHARVFDTEISYDGATLATYDEQTNELTLSYPSPEELQEGNPLLLAKSVIEWCNPMFAPEQPQGMYFLILVPKIEGSEIVNVSIMARKSDLLPTTIVIRNVNQTTTLQLKQQQWSKQLPVTTIPTNHEGQPAPFLNDLR